MRPDPHATLADLVLAISDTVDLVHPSFHDHHKRVAYVAHALATELGWPAQRKAELLMAGLLHDVGALSQRERLDLLRFEADFRLPPDEAHGEIGYRLLRRFEPFVPLAEIIRHHHAYWDQAGALGDVGVGLSLDSSAIFLADRIEILLEDDRPVLGQVSEIRERIEAESGGMFAPELVEAFEALSHREYFWFGLVDRDLYGNLAHVLAAHEGRLDQHQLPALARLLCQLVDYKSRFTATHTAGVAAVAHRLAQLAHMTDETCTAVELAGQLHDLGKLAVPSDLLEKPGRLEPEEFHLVQSHVFHTHRILSRIEILEDIEPWAARHHERLDGRGYPFHHAAPALPEPARVVAVADVFTALTEERPYRSAMPVSRALAIVDEQVADGHLDGDVVQLLTRHRQDLDDARAVAQQEARMEYQLLQSHEVSQG